MSAWQPEDDVTAGTVLRSAGVVATAQRTAVFDELRKESDDLTAQELHRRLKGRGERIGLATVYRALDALAGAGLVERLSHFRGELCYRVCQAGHHHHLVCTECHTIVELGDCRLEKPLARAAAEHGFTATGHQLEVKGVCAACAATT